MIEIIKKHKWFLIGLFIFSFLIRATVFIGYLSKNKNYWQIDSNTYHLLAQQLIKGEGLCTQEGPNFYRLPGYPVFLAIYYKLFGIDTKNVLLMQIFLAALIPILIFLLAYFLFPTNILIAKASAIYSGIHLGFIFYSGFFMTETLFIFLFLIFAILFLLQIHLFFCPQNKDSSQEDYAFMRYFSLPEPITTSEPYLILFEDMFENEQEQMIQSWCNKSWCKKNNLIQPPHNLFWAGLALGLAALVRPVGHYLICLAGLIILFSNETWKQKFSSEITLFLGWLIPVSFWLIRNFILTGYLFLHTLPGGHFLYFSASRIVMHEYNCSYEQANSILRERVANLIKNREIQKQKPLSEIEKCYIRENLAKHYFKKYPFLALKLWLTDIFRTSFSLYSAELLYLESSRPEFDYFSRKRTITSLLKRYLFPATDKLWLKFIIFFEILSYLFILLGILFGFIKILAQNIKSWGTMSIKRDLCSWLRTIPFIALFIITGLAGGYARIRLPAEPFLTILSMSFWVTLFAKNKTLT